ncbi:MAG: IclR family transcriptional regulator [Spirochaetes bacterium]|nr:IclR family transcriptional regulator [Spirochaetota bacterium]
MDKKTAVKSVYKAVKILELISQEKSLTVPEISRILDLPKSSTYEIIITLLSAGILEKQHDTNAYHLGPKLVEFGVRAQENLEVRRISRPFLQDLNRELDETVHLTILDDDEVLYVECFESTKSLRTYSVIGVRAPLYCTAVGKAILAMQDRDEIERIILKSGLKRYTENTLTSKDKLLKELKITAERGYAIDDIEHEEGVRCIGAPIFDFSGNVYASISISGPTQRITPEKVPGMGELIKKVALNISKKMGYSPL